MLIEVPATGSCLNCGNTTNIISTRTQYFLCSDDCEYSLWLDDIHKIYKEEKQDE